jgi:hypothetical protein
MPRQHQEGCAPPAEVSSRPQSIEDTVALVNAMPRPLTLPCFLEALARPLPLHATLSQFSAQPASGARSPRLFLYFEPLIMTVVPAGIGHPLLELGEQRTGYRSLKGELRFPLEARVMPGEVYEHTRFRDDLTGCAFCHAEEEVDQTVPGGTGFVSQALRPLASERVSLDSLHAEQDVCDAELEPDRCALLDALFGWGEVVGWEFPQEMATFGR